MKRTIFQHPTILDDKGNVVQQGTYSKESPLVNATNDGVLDYINNNLEALRDNINGSRIYVANKDALPAMGDLSAMYISEDTGKWYLWDGTKYIETDNARKIVDEALAIRDAAKTSETNAKTSETNAATSANTATTQASNASQSASSASASASTATTKATDASNSANLSKAWAMSDSSPDGVSGNKSSKTWATASANSASEASTYASNAANSATAASQSAFRAATFDPSNYPLKKYTLDLSALDENTFYPVVFNEKYKCIEAEIHSRSSYVSYPFNQNVLAFRAFSAGWNDGANSMTIKDYYVHTTNEITIGCVAFGQRDGGVCVWLRGGEPSPYTIISTVEPQLFSNGYSSAEGQIATIGSTYHGAETGNTNMNIMFSPLDIPSSSAKNFDYTTYGTFEKAIKDSDGNIIKDTYATKADISNEVTTKNLNSANLTVTGPTCVPTANAGNSSNAIASTEFVAKSIATLVDSAPDQLNTLNELAKALGNDSNFASTVTAELAKKLNSAEAESTYATKTEAGVPYQIKRNTAYEVGDVLTSPSLPPGCVIVVTQAGATGSTEPDWTTIKSNMWGGNN